MDELRVLARSNDPDRAVSCDVRAASVLPSTSDIMLQRRERRDGANSVTSGRNTTAILFAVTPTRTANGTKLNRALVPDRSALPETEPDRRELAMRG
jgi:hypothetical protein